MNFSYVAQASLLGGNDDEWITGLLGLVDIFTYDGNGRIVDIRTHSVIVLSETSCSTAAAGDRRARECNRVAPAVPCRAVTFDTPLE